MSKSESQPRSDQPKQSLHNRLSFSHPFRKSSASISSSATNSSSGSTGPQSTPLSPQPSTLRDASISGKPAMSSIREGAQEFASPSSKKKKSSGGSSTASSAVKAGSSSSMADSGTSAAAAGNVATSRRHMRRESSLTEKGASVLRALARAPEDDTPNGSPTGIAYIRNGDDDVPSLRIEDGPPSGSSGSAAPSLSPKSPVSDDGYNPETIASPGRRPQPFAFTTLDGVGDDNGTTGDVSRAGSFVGLSEAAKETGRKNRQGLRRRGEQKEVEKLVGPTRGKRGGADGEKKKTKSWEIPRKVFHSSIGFIVLYLYVNDFNLTNIVRTMTTFLAIVSTADVIRLNYPPFERFYESVLGFLMREAEKEKVNGVVWYLIGVIFSLHFYPADIACVSVMMLSWADTCASTFGRLFGRYTPPLPSPPFASRKSLSGFLAAVVAGSLTALLFWGTDIAKSHERFDGVSWSSDHSIFGATSAGSWHSGWNGLAWGFRGHLGPALAEGGYKGRMNAVLQRASHATGHILSNEITTKVPGMPLWALCLGSGFVAAVAEGLELGGVDDNLSLPILSGFGMWALLFSWGRAASWWAGAF